MFTFNQKCTLTRILKEHKRFTEELPTCFRDDEEVDELLKIIESEEMECQKIKTLQQ